MLRKSTVNIVYDGVPHCAKRGKPYKQHIRRGMETGKVKRHAFE